MLHELDDAALVVEFLGADAVFEALIVEQDADAFIEEGELPQAIGKDIPLVLVDLKDLAVGLEGDVGARVAGRVRSGKWRLGDAALEAHVMRRTVAPHFDFEPFAEGVDARHTDAVQAAGDFVGIMVEFAAGVQEGKDDFDGGHAGFVHDARGRRHGSDHDLAKG